MRNCSRAGQMLLRRTVLDRHLSKFMISISSLLVSALAMNSRNSSRLTAAGSVFCMTATTPANMHSVVRWCHESWLQGHSSSCAGVQISGKQTKRCGGRQ